MVGEINKDFYCSLSWTPEGCPSCTEPPETCDKLDCKCRHRKHPTPEQFKEEYGHDYPDDGAVYIMWNNHWDNRTAEPSHVMTLREFRDEWVKESGWPNVPIVCACTPWGRPSNKWRPS